MRRQSTMLQVIINALVVIMFFAGAFALIKCTANKQHAEVAKAAENAAEAVTEPIKYYSDAEVVMLAKLLYMECRGVESDTEKACVAWTVCNRVDAGDEFADQKSVTSVILADNQYVYDRNAPVDMKLAKLAEDVLIRWNAERQGCQDVGRVLPAEYLFFTGDGEHNYFRAEFDGTDIWDYSLESPYTEG